MRSDPTTVPGLRREGVSTIGETMPALIQVLAANVDRAARRDTDSYLSPAEVALLEAMNMIGLRPELQQPVGAYDLDFLFPAVGLCVEVDGSQHYQTHHRDFRRDGYLRDVGISTMRIAAKRVFRDAIACARQVEAEIRRRTKLGNAPLDDAEIEIVEALLDVADRALEGRPQDQSVEDLLVERAAIVEAVRTLRGRTSKIHRDEVRADVRRWVLANVVRPRRAARKVLT